MIWSEFFTSQSFFFFCKWIQFNCKSHNHNMSFFFVSVIDDTIPITIIIMNEQCGNSIINKKKSFFLTHCVKFIGPNQKKNLYLSSKSILNQKICCFFMLSKTPIHYSSDRVTIGKNKKNAIKLLVVMLKCPSSHRFHEWWLHDFLSSLLLLLLLLVFIINKLMSFKLP